MSSPQTQRSVPEVLRDIVDNLQEIIRSEFRLAKTEMSEKAGKAARPAATLTAGFILALYGMGFLLLAAVYGLSIIMSPWMAALLVGVILAVIAGALITVGRKQLRRVNPSPDKAIKSLEEDVKWAKQRIT